MKDILDIRNVGQTLSPFHLTQDLSALSDLSAAAKKGVGSFKIRQERRMFPLWLGSCVRDLYKEMFKPEGLCVG